MYHPSAIAAAAAAVLAAQNSGAVSSLQQTSSAAANIQATGTTSNIPIAVTEEVVQSSQHLNLDLNK